MTGPTAAARLAAANVVASVRAGRLRLSFHLVNSPEDADVVAETLAGRSWAARAGPRDVTDLSSDADARVGNTNYPWRVD